MSTPTWRLAFALGLTTALAACSRPDTPPPPAREPISAEQATEALGGVPYEVEQAGPSLILPDEFMDRWKPWTGDLDGIVARRFLRVLVTCNSTSDYVDRGRQGGITYEMFRLLEKELDRRFRAGALGIDVTARRAAEG
jgi:hypothetical protein